MERETLERGDTVSWWQADFKGYDNYSTYASKREAKAAYKKSCMPYTGSRHLKEPTEHIGMVESVHYYGAYVLDFTGGKEAVQLENCKMTKLNND